jgi:hypothetical protein
MYEPLNDPPRERSQVYNALQYLIGAAAGCVVASLIAVGVVIWLAQSGTLSTKSWQTVIKLVAATPVLGAVSGALVLVMNGRRS